VWKGFLLSLFAFLSKNGENQEMRSKSTQFEQLDGQQETKGDPPQSPSMCDDVFLPTSHYFDCHLPFTWTCFLHKRE